MSESLYIDKIVYSGQTYGTRDERVETIASASAGQVMTVDTTGLEPKIVATTLNKGYDSTDSTANVAWNTEYRLGSQSAIEVTFPNPTAGYSNEIRIVYTATSATAPVFHTPAGYQLLGMGDITITSGNLYEISIAVLDASHIGVACKEWTL